MTTHGKSIMDINSSRRRALKAGLGATLFLPQPFAWVWAQSDGALKLMRAPKVALVIGNSGYKTFPLGNPANDARAIGAALTATGFDVTTRLDAPHGELAKAVQAYTQTLAQRQAVGLFYFAGHGLQLAWRNYMVPVDASVRTASDIQAQCVELGDLLAGITKARNPLNVIILDACRDNPFGNLSGVDQKGLSQMDAPPGTLLAYATAPGNVASDGEGVNGLYTEHLLKEIGVPEAKVEDVFKRVRLHVRRRTHGRQIPWESTSLEEDFWFVPPRTLAAAAQAEAERERKEREAVLEKQRLAEEAERKRKLEEAQRQARLAAEEAERKRKEELAALEKQRLAEEAERKRKLEEAQRQARLAAEEAERKRREEQALLEAKRAEEEAERRYKQELALREKQRQQDEAERKRREEQALLEAKRAEEEAERKRKEAVAQRGTPLSSGGKVDPERQFAEELAIWEKIKTSTTREPLEDYLLRYPSGRFSELAQFQLDRVLARAGETRVVAVTSAANPFTKGTLRADTSYKVGDLFRYRETDLYTKDETRVFANRVSSVTDLEVHFNNGNFVTDHLGNVISNASPRVNARFTGTQFYLAEYSVGKRWSSRFQRLRGDWPPRDVNWDLRVVTRESIKVPAGVFDAFRIEGSGWTVSNDGNTTVQLQSRYWVVPHIPRYVAFETINRVMRGAGSVVVSERQELVGYRRA